MDPVRIVALLGFIVLAGIVVYVVMRSRAVGRESREVARVPPGRRRALPAGGRHAPLGALRRRRGPAPSPRGRRCAPRDRPCRSTALREHAVDGGLARRDTRGSRPQGQPLPTTSPERSARSTGSSTACGPSPTRRSGSATSRARPSSGAGTSSCSTLGMRSPATRASPRSRRADTREGGPDTHMWCYPRPRPRHVVVRGGGGVADALSSVR